MKKNIKICFTNCWQSSNTGDIAIWKNLMKHIVGAFSDTEFLIASQTLLDWDKKQLSEYKVKFYINNLEQAVKDADIVISQGGGYMIGDNMAQYLKSFDLAQKLGKPTFFSTQTFVGPINDETKSLLTKVLNNALLVSPREKDTYDFLVSNGVNKDKLEILPDTVFDIGIKNYEFPHYNAIKFAIRGYMIDTRFVKEIAKLADMVAETMGKVVFIPIGHGGDRDDRLIAKEIAGYMKHEAVVIEDKLTAEELKSTLRDGILISDRYHGIVYSASMGTPFVPISSDIDYKMNGLLQLLDYPIQDVLDKNTFTTENAFPIVFDTWYNKSKYSELLKMKIPKIKEDAKKVYSKIIEGIKNANIN